ncbi:fumarylacetoacetate hydrolase family protein [Pseudovibrio exalbescens]|uniref:fumarylacetoacetate hydrolase family protein n=1 Tax=Pseudovibrio exalbescens TaxID=197461 RepID=UPI0023652424|nr:fumarylacetoacetate hydrolase family protein [Pseudovibrio exalbescens]MDD7911610.1 fumarylacetoacetate hydrolase family protein [Pseudovibrio exalbescens]
MKFLRFGEKGAEKPGIFHNGEIKDLSAHVSELSGHNLDPDSLAQVARLDLDALPTVQDAPRLGPCVSGTGKFICIGLNYSDHAAEAGMQVPPEPIIFMKATSAISGPNDPIELPRGSTTTDWEAELGVVIGRHAKYVSEEDALDHVAGYCIVNDVSERTYQTQRSGQWTKGKSADTFGPVGPWLVTPDELGDPHALSIRLQVNGIIRQEGSSSTMVYRIPFLISYLSQFMSLHPGDIIATGTPPGVGMGMKPPVYLQDGDIVHIEIEGLGTQTQRVKAADG